MNFRRILVSAEAGGEGGTGAPTAVDGNGAGVPGGAAAGGAGGAGAPAGSGAWFSGFTSPENRGFAELKGFKNPETLVESYRNLEKLMGVPKERLLTLPDKPDAPEWKQIYDRLGRPEKPELYDVKIPEGGSPEFAKWAQGMFHELGLTKTQGETLAAKWNEQATLALQAQADTQKTETDSQVQALKKEWGAAYQEKVQKNAALLNTLGIDDKAYDKIRGAMGIDGAEKFFDSIITKFGIQLGEAGFRGSGGGNNSFSGALSPEAAKEKVNTLLRDPEYVKRYTNGGAAETAEMGKLHEYMVARGD